jgi:hypothetical protein
VYHFGLLWVLGLAGGLAVSIGMSRAGWMDGFEYGAVAAMYRLSPDMNGVFRNRPLTDDWVSVSGSWLVAAP